MKNALLLALSLFGLTALASASEDGFRVLGEFIIRSRVKMTGDKLTPVPIKPLKLVVSTDGEYVKLSTEGNEDSGTTFKIYRSDGIAKQNAVGGALEVVPGIQATADQGGVHQHLRLTREGLTLTSFPGVSDQTVITTAAAITPEPSAKAP